MIRRAPALAALLAAFAVVMLPSGAAFAQEEDYPKLLEKSTYLQLSGVVAFPDFANTIGETSGGLNVRAGLRATAYVAVEAEFEWLSGQHPDGNPSGAAFESECIIEKVPRQESREEEDGAGG